MDRGPVCDVPWLSAWLKTSKQSETTCPPRDAQQARCPVTLDCHSHCQQIPAYCLIQPNTALGQLLHVHAEHALRGGLSLPLHTPPFPW